MGNAALSHLVDPLREMLDHYMMILRGYREKSGVTLLGYSCMMIPPEVPASFGLIPLRIPSAVRGTGGCCSGALKSAGEYIAGIYDHVLLPGSGSCCIPADLTLSCPVHRFKVPGGYGTEAAEALHHALDELLAGTGMQGISMLDAERLREVTDEYNTLRRLVRGISSLRVEKTDLLSNEDLWIIYEAAASLPPELLLGSLAAVLDALNVNGIGRRNADACTVMISGGHLTDGGLLDEIERAECIIQEDDFCNGRRQFDISHNPSSIYLYYEILDAFSYCPLCASLRPAAERFELLYKMIRNYGIRMVIILKDTLCGDFSKEIDFLRVKLMRAGIDPLITDSASAEGALKEYLDAVKWPPAE